jgi:hypothetical protein
MGKYFKQTGHYRTYKDTGKRITVNGGPSSDAGGAIAIILMIIAAPFIFMYMYPMTILLWLLLFGVSAFAFSKDGEHTTSSVLSGVGIGTLIYTVIMIIYVLVK